MCKDLEQSSGWRCRDRKSFSYRMDLDNTWNRSIFLHLGYSQFHHFSIGFIGKQFLTQHAEKSYGFHSEVHVLWRAEITLLKINCTVKFCGRKIICNWDITVYDISQTSGNLVTIWKPELPSSKLVRDENLFQRFLFSQLEIFLWHSYSTFWSTWDFSAEIILCESPLVSTNKI